MTATTRPQPTYMFWSCASKTPLAASVAEAMRHYTAKHGHAPNVVLVNAKELAALGGRLVVGGVTVGGSKAVIRGHLHVGMGQTSG